MPPLPSGARAVPSTSRMLELGPSRTVGGTIAAPAGAAAKRTIAIAATSNFVFHLIKPEKVDRICRVLVKAGMEVPDGCRKRAGRAQSRVQNRAPVRASDRRVEGP